MEAGDPSNPECLAVQSTAFFAEVLFQPDSLLWLRFVLFHPVESEGLRFVLLQPLEPTLETSEIREPTLETLEILDLERA